MYRTDNPIADFNRWDAEQERALSKLPECSECGEKITDEECYEFNDELICPECLKDNHRKWTEDYME
jgi:formylmethanofuran dehydrogenase subunit E